MSGRLIGLVCTAVLAVNGFSYGSGVSSAMDYVSSTPTLRSMARLYMAYGMYDEAAPLAERALKLAKQQNADNEELAMCLIDLGTLYQFQEKLGEAEQMVELGLIVQRAANGRNHPYVSHTLMTLCSIYRQKGQYDKATRRLEEGYAVLHSNYPDDIVMQIPFDIERAKLLAEQGRLEEADELFLRAIDTTLGRYSEDNLYTAGMFCEYAEFKTQMLDFKTASKYVNKALPTQEQYYGKESMMVVPAWLTKAKVCRYEGNFGLADQYVNRAISATGKTNDPVRLSRLFEQIAAVNNIGQYAAAAGDELEQ